MERPELNVFLARSTWVAIFTVLANVMLLAGWTPLDPGEASDQVMAVITAVGAAWVYFERVTGQMKLVKPWAAK